MSKHDEVITSFLVNNPEYRKTPGIYDMIVSLLIKQKSHKKLCEFRRKFVALFDCTLENCNFIKDDKCEENIKECEDFDCTRYKKRAKFLNQYLLINEDTEGLEELFFRLYENKVYSDAYRIIFNNNCIEHCDWVEVENYCQLTAFKKSRLGYLADWFSTYYSASMLIHKIDIDGHETCFNALELYYDYTLLEQSVYEKEELLKPFSQGE